MLRAMRERRDRRAAAHALYTAVVAQARDPGFYTDYRVADTVDGRFDLIALHAFLLLGRLKAETEEAGKAAEAAALAQEVFDLMFGDMDRSLREMGVGDLSVGKKVKAMAKAFYGRVDAYDAGLKATDDGTLEGALARNLYRGAPPDAPTLGALARYLRQQAFELSRCEIGRLLRGEFRFKPPEAMERSAH